MIKPADILFKHLSSTRRDHIQPTSAAHLLNPLPQPLALQGLHLINHHPQPLTQPTHAILSNHSRNIITQLPILGRTRGLLRINPRHSLHRLHDNIQRTMERLELDESIVEDLRDVHGWSVELFGTLAFWRWMGEWDGVWKWEGLSAEETSVRVEGWIAGEDVQGEGLRGCLTVEDWGKSVSGVEGRHFELPY